MIVLGISSLDKDSTASVVADGNVQYAIAEERLSRVKQHAGFPWQSIKMIFEKTGLTPGKVDIVTYPFHEWQHETGLLIESYIRDFVHNFFRFNWQSYNKLNLLSDKKRRGLELVEVPGLPPEKYYMNKPKLKKLIYEILSGNPVSDKIVHQVFFLKWILNSIGSHRFYSMQLRKGLRKLGLGNKLKRVDHHNSHAYGAYFCSGFSRALVVTMDAYGSGLAGKIFLGEDLLLTQLKKIPYPHSMGLFYEGLTSSLGFLPSRHEGKIVGLAAYGDPQLLFETVQARFRMKNGDFKYINGQDILFNRMLSLKFGKIDIAAACQRVLERVICETVEYYIKKYKLNKIVFAGGVAGNVKLNQRIFEIKGVDQIFIYPNMGDGGTATGAALMVTALIDRSLKSRRIEAIYYGPEYSDSEMRDALASAGLHYEKISNIEKIVAQLIAKGNIIGRFNGRMEYGPRALGNRSILYKASDYNVNLWLNKQLGRTEFMPFAPSTLYEYRAKYYHNIEGADYAAEFMTITFNCTDFMKKTCPAAIHIDGTARPQLVRKEANENYYRIIDEYRKITGIATIINTSFNMHEEPIVCSPQDAIRAFKLGKLHYLAMGNYLAKGQDRK